MPLGVSNGDLTICQLVTSVEFIFADVIFYTMIGAILGAATSVASGIAGGIKARRAERKYKKEMADLQKKQQDWYNQKANEDYTQRADVQRLLNSSKDAAINQLNQQAGRSIVSGGTEESMMAARQAANQGIADATANIAAQASAYKDAVDQQNQQNISNNAQRMMNYYAQSAANAQQAASEGMKAGMGMLSADAMSSLKTGRGMFENMFRKK